MGAATAIAATMCRSLMAGLHVAMTAFRCETCKRQPAMSIPTRYDRARVSLDRQATHVVAAFLAGAAR